MAAGMVVVVGGRYLDCVFETSSAELTLGNGTSGTGTPRNSQSGSQPCFTENSSTCVMHQVDGGSNNRQLDDMPKATRTYGQNEVHSWNRSRAGRKQRSTSRQTWFPAVSWGSAVRTRPGEFNAPRRGSEVQTVQGRRLASMV